MGGETRTPKPIASAPQVGVVVPAQGESRRIEEIRARSRVVSPTCQRCKGGDWEKSLYPTYCKAHKAEYSAANGKDVPPLSSAAARFRESQERKAGQQLVGTCSKCPEPRLKSGGFCKKHKNEWAREKRKVKEGDTVSSPTLGNARVIANQAEPSGAVPVTLTRDEFRDAVGHHSMLDPGPSAPEGAYVLAPKNPAIEALSADQKQKLERTLAAVNTGWEEVNGVDYSPSRDVRVEQIVKAARRAIGFLIDRASTFDQAKPIALELFDAIAVLR